MGRKIISGLRGKNHRPGRRMDESVSVNVTGYVYSEYITVGNEAQKKAEELVQKKDTENAKEAFTYAESKEERPERLQKEAEQKAEEEKKGG